MRAAPKGLLRDGWHLMLTNLSREQADVSQLAAIYRARSRGGNPVSCMEAGAQPQQSPGSSRVRRIRSRPEARRTRQANSEIPP